MNHHQGNSNQQQQPFYVYQSTLPPYQYYSQPMPGYSVPLLSGSTIPSYAPMPQYAPAMHQQVLPMYFPQSQPQQAPPPHFNPPSVAQHSQQKPIAPYQQPESRNAMMKIGVKIKKRCYQAWVNDKKHSTTINIAVQEFVLRGPAPMNDTIIVPLEVKGRTIEISCIVLNQQEKLIIGRQCLQAFGLLTGIVPKPSVHMRLGPQVSRSNSHRHRNNYQSHRREHNSSDNNWRPYRNFSSSTEELKRILYPGNESDNEVATERNLIEFDD